MKRWKMKKIYIFQWEKDKLENDHFLLRIMMSEISCFGQQEFQAAPCVLTELICMSCNLIWLKWSQRCIQMFKNEKQGLYLWWSPDRSSSLRAFSFSLQAPHSLHLSFSCPVCWGVSNQERQAADGMTMLNWHGVVGTRKQTAAIFILLVSPSSLFLMNKSRRREEVEQQPGSCREAELKERKREEEEEEARIGD